MSYRAHRSFIAVISAIEKQYYYYYYMILCTPVRRIVHVMILYTNAFFRFVDFIMQIIIFWHCQTVIFNSCRRDMRWKLRAGAMCFVGVSTAG